MSAKTIFTMSDEIPNKKDLGERRHENDDNDDFDDDDQKDDGLLFKDMTPAQKARSSFIVLFKLIGFLACLYVFICSLGLLESAFQLLGGKTAGEAFGSGVLSNPFAGLMIGVLATVLVQSSSTSTSIVVTMVGSSIIPVEKAVPIVMGANIGTSVTNTLVSLAQANNRKEFRRAFAGATVHDMFNWLSVIILLPIEIACGYLYHFSAFLVRDVGNPGSNETAGEKPPKMLKALTEPVLSLIVKINKNVISEIASKSNKTGDVLKRWCKSTVVLANETVQHSKVITVDCSKVLTTSPLHDVCNSYDGDSELTVAWESLQQINKTIHVERCENLFAQADLSDAACGAILLVCSLILLLAALFLIVRLLNSLLSGSVTRLIKKFINADFPGHCAYFTPYVALLVGCGLTMVVQSSSVFTSTLTPMVGLGIVSVERMYPMTLGANIGTTMTGILAALSQSNEHIKHALQIALCHLFFNISGILIFFPIPFMRWPIGMAKILGKTTSKHRWFAVVYLVIMFIILPGSVFGLSVAGWTVLAAVGGPIVLFLLLIGIVNAIQRKRPSFLPRKLRNWNFLPLWCHSLKPVDRLIGRVCTCGYCRTLQETSKEDGPFEFTVEMEGPGSKDDQTKQPNGPPEYTLDVEVTENGGKPVGKSGLINNGFQSDTRF